MGIRKFLSILIVVSLIASPNSFALPTLQEIEAGNVVFEQVNDKTLNITASENSIINYSSFNIASDEVVNFFLPTLDAFALNRIFDSGASQILGTLTANGNLILVNTNGFYFGNTADVNVGGIVASAHDIQNTDFLNGNYLFAGLGDSASITASSILNEGNIKTRDGGFAVMVADAIENRGTIEAPMGTVALAAGDVVTIGLSQDGLISVAIDKETAHQIVDKDGNPITDQIKNSGTLTAAGGKVTLNAKAMDQIFEKAINTSGLVQADSVAVGEDGTIEFFSNGVNENSGAIRAKTFDEKGYTFRNTETGLIDGGLDADGNVQTGDAYYDNLDGAANLSGVIGSNQTDVGDLIVTGNVTLNADNLIFTADSDNDGTGRFTMNAGTQIDGSGYSLTLRTGQSSSLELLLNLAMLNLERSGSASTPTYTAATDIGPATTFSGLTIGANTTFNLNGKNLAMAASTGITNNGTIILFGNESLTNVANLDIDSGTVRYRGTDDDVTQNHTLLDFGATDYYNLIIDLVDQTEGDTIRSQAAKSIAGTLSVTNYAIYEANGNSTTVGGATSVTAFGLYTGSSGAQTFNGNLSIDGDSSMSITSSAMQVNGNFNLDGTFNGGTGTVDVNGDFTVGATGNVNDVPNNLSVSGNYAFNASGTLSSALTADFDGTGTQTLSSGGKTFLTLTHSGSGTLQLVNNAVGATGHFLNTHASGIFDLNGQNLTVGGNETNNGTIRLRGSESINIMGSHDVDSGTWQYVGDGDGVGFVYTLKDFGATDYFNLTINDTTPVSDTFEMGNAVDIDGNFTLSDGTFDMNDLQMNVAGNFAVSGAGTFFSSASNEVVFDGSGTHTLDTGGDDMGAMRTSGTGTLQLVTSNLSANQSLTIGANTTLDLNGLGLQATNVFSNSGTMRLRGDEGIVLTGGNDIDSGTWEYKGDGDGVQDTYTVKNFGASDYFHLLINSTDTGANKDIFQLGSSLDLDGNLTVTSGILSLNGNNITDAAGGSVANLSNIADTVRLRGSETVFWSTNDTDSGTWEYVGDGDNAQDTFVIKDFAAAGTADYFNLIFNSTDTGANKDIFRMDNTLSMDGSLTITSGILSMNGNIIEDPSGGGTASLSNIADTLRLRGSETVFWTTNDTNSGTYEYVGNNAGSSFVLLAFTGTDYYNLTINATNSGDTFQQAANPIEIGGALTVTSGTYDSGLRMLTVTGLATVNGGTFNGDSNTKTFNGGLTVSSGAFDSNSSTIDVNGNFSQSGGTFDAPDNTAAMTVSGNFSHTAGTFNHNNGTVTLDGGNQTISGSTTFYNLTKTDSSNNSTDLTLTFDNTATQTIASGGTLTLTGTDADDRVNLVSDSPGTRWELTCLTCNLSISWADVTDSDASGGSAITQSNTVNGGNNLNWTFGITSTWTGLSSSVWNLAGNWNNGVPGVNDTAIIADVDNDPALNLNVTLTNLTINSGGLLSLAGFNLTVSSTFSNDGTLRLQGGETVSLTQDINSGTWEYVGVSNAMGTTFTLKDFGATDYYNLLLNSSDIDVFQSGAAKSIAGTLTVTNSTYDGNGNTTTVTGTTTLNSSGTYTGGAAAQTFDGAVNISGGTLNAGSGGTDFNSDMSLSSGTLTASGAISIAGNWSKTGGTFNPGLNTVTFDKGAGTQTLDTGTGTSFHGLTHSGAGTLRLVNTGFGSTGTVTNSAGIFDLNGQGFGGTGGLSNTATIRLNGSESISFTTNDTDTGTWEFVGDNDGTQDTFTVKDFGGSDYFNLIFNSADSGANKDIFQLGSGLAIDGALTVTSGILSLNGNSITDIAGGAAATLSNIADTVRLRGSETVFWSTNDTDSGTWEYVGDGDGNADTYNLTFAGGSDYFNLVVNMTDANDILQPSSGSVGLNGAFTITNGIYYMNGGDLEDIPGGATASLGNIAGTLRLKGSETVFWSTNDTDSGTWEYVGNNTGSIFTLLDFGGTDYYNLRINAANSGDEYRASSAKGIAGAFTVTSGTYNANSATTVTGLTTVNGGTYSVNSTQTFNGGLTISSGSYSGGPHTSDINGDFTQSGGTFTAPGPAGSFMVSGNFARSGGTFTHNSGAVIFDGTTNLTSNGAVFNNVTIGTNTASGSVTLMDNADINGDLTFNTTGGTTSLTATSRTINYAGATLNFTNLDTFSASGSSWIFDGTTTLTSASKQLGNVSVGSAAAGGSLTLADNADFSGNITFGTGGSNALDISNRTLSTGTASLNMTNLATFTSTGSTLNFYSTLTLTSAGKAFNNITFGGASPSLTLADNLDMNGVFDFTGGTSTFDMTNRTINYEGSALNFTGLDTFTSTGSTFIFDNAVTLTSASKTLNNITIGTNIASGSLTLADSADINGTISFNTTGGTAILDSSNRTVNYAGSSLNLTSADTFTTTGSTWIFDGTTSLTSAGKIFNNVTIGTNTASGSLTLLDTTDVNGFLTFNTTGGTTALDMTNVSLNYSAGTLDFTNLDTLTSTGSTLTLDGAADQAVTAAGKTFHHFTVNNTGAGGLDDVTFTGNLDINGNFTLTDGNFHAPGVMNIGDDFNFSGGTFDANNGEVILDTTATAVLNVPVAGIDFWDFTIATAGKTVQFTSGDTFNILSANTFTVTGASGNLVTLESTGGGQWNMSAAGADLRYASVEDSNNTGAGVTCTDCFDAGNNTGWTFLTSSPVTPPQQTPIDNLGNLTNIIENVGGGFITPPAGQGTVITISPEGFLSIFPVAAPVAPTPVAPAPAPPAPAQPAPEPAAPAEKTTPSSESSSNSSSNNNGNESNSSSSNNEGSNSNGGGPGGNDGNGGQNGNGGGPNGGDPNQPNYKKDDPWQFFEALDSTKYKTVVLVYEGAVYVQNYDKKGKVTSQKEGVLLTEKMSTKVEWNKEPERPKKMVKFRAPAVGLLGLGVQWMENYAATKTAERMLKS